MRFLFFAVLIYLIYSIINKMFVKPFRQGASQNDPLNQKRYSYKNPFQSKKEGEVSIDYNPNENTPKRSKSVGEYVDFEEVDDDKK